MKNPLSKFYDLELKAGNLHLSRKAPTSLLFLTLSIPGWILFILGFWVHFSLILFGLIVALAPWIRRNWLFPDRIEIGADGFITLTTGRLIPNIVKVAIEEIIGIQIEKRTKHADANPFQEGNKEVIYEFFLETPSTMYRCLILQLRQEDDTMVDSIHEFLKKSIASIKR